MKRLLKSISAGTSFSTTCTINDVVRLLKSVNELQGVDISIVTDESGNSAVRIGDYVYSM